MNAFASVLSDIFDRGAEQRLSLDEERETIRAAKAGDEAATVALMYAYAATLRNCAARYRNAGSAWDGNTFVPDMDADDARMVAVEGLLTAVAAFNLDGPHERLAALIWGYVSERFNAYMSEVEGVSTVPQRTLTRFYHILNAAGRDVHVAASIAPSYKMATDTFLAVLTAVRGSSIFDDESEEGAERVQQEARPVWAADGSDAFADATDRILVELAFTAVDDLETDICRMSYGFTDYLPVPDGQIAHELGMTRPTVQRRRAGALGKMRAALGA